MVRADCPAASGVPAAKLRVKLFGEPYSPQLNPCKNSLRIQTNRQRHLSHRVPGKQSNQE